MPARVTVAHPFADAKDKCAVRQRVLLASTGFVTSHSAFVRQIMTD